MAQIRPTARFLTCTLAVVLSGCFRHVPAQLETTPPGEAVRVLVTDQGASELRAVTEVGELAPVVSGTLVGLEGTDLLLSVPVGQIQEGFILSALNQTIRVPTGEIVTFERRELDKVRTGLFVGGVGAFATAVVLVIAEARKGEVPGEDFDPPDLGVSFNLLALPIGR